jgi:hypothetical protein
LRTRTPDIEVDPPLFIKALCGLVGASFGWVAGLVARDALTRPFSVWSWLWVLALLAITWAFFGLLVWRTRLFVEADGVVLERRGYLGARFVLETRAGEVLLDQQWVGVDEQAERLAKRLGRPLRQA